MRLLSLPLLPIFLVVAVFRFEWRCAVMASDVNDDALTDQQCHEKYGNHTLTWIAESVMFDKYPPHLLSQPGSGSSWLRQLLEFSTGFHSGSVDTFDFEYLEPGHFAGERACGLRMCVLRAHPHHFDFTRGQLRFRHNYIRDKCKRGLIREIKRLIILVTVYLVIAVASPLP